MAKLDYLLLSFCCLQACKLTTPKQTGLKPYYTVEEKNRLIITRRTKCEANPEKVWTQETCQFKRVKKCRAIETYDVTINRCLPNKLDTQTVLTTAINTMKFRNFLAYCEGQRGKEEDRALAQALMKSVNAENCQKAGNLLLSKKELSLARQNLTSLNALRDFDQLQILHLAQNQITDLSPLSELKNLTEIDLSNNEVDDLSALKRLNQLEALYLGENPIVSLLPISPLDKLIDLDMGLTPLDLEESEGGTDKTPENCPKDANSPAVVEFCSMDRTP